MAMKKDLHETAAVLVVEYTGTDLTSEFVVDNPHETCNSMRTGSRPVKLKFTMRPDSDGRYGNPVTNLSYISYDGKTYDGLGREVLLIVKCNKSVYGASVVSTRVESSDQILSSGVPAHILVTLRCRLEAKNTNPLKVVK
jgi:hypothetical protein